MNRATKPKTTTMQVMKLKITKKKKKINANATQLREKKIHIPKTLCINFLEPS